MCHPQSGVAEDLAAALQSGLVDCRKASSSFIVMAAIP
jgi:hypothetical protein